MAAPQLLYGTAWKEDETARLVEQALRVGFRGIDTANQRKHYYEEGVGEGLAAAIADGVVRRDDVFLQTKFTYRRGQDQRLPYDPDAPLADQVRQSFERSLEHLRTDYLDALILHGPERPEGLSTNDREVWATMSELVTTNRVRQIGVSNISRAQLDLLLDASDVAPAYVQNRCYAREGWDAEVRAVCRERGVIYQGFSLLTANRAALESAALAEIAAYHEASVAQVVFAFARQVGMLPLTGTTDEQHMREDLDSLALTLPNAELLRVERVLTP